MRSRDHRVGGRVVKLIPLLGEAKVTVLGNKVWCCHQDVTVVMVVGELCLIVVTITAFKGCVQSHRGMYYQTPVVCRCVCLLETD